MLVVIVAIHRVEILEIVEISIQAETEIRGQTKTMPVDPVHRPAVAKEPSNGPQVDLVTHSTMIQEAMKEREVEIATYQIEHHAKDLTAIQRKRRA